MLVIVAAVLGYVVALPVMIWHRRDLQSFRGPLWAGIGSRSSRLRGALWCYAVVGWPEVIAALGWRASITREALVAEREDFREARHHAHT